MTFANRGSLDSSTHSVQIQLRLPGCFRTRPTISASGCSPKRVENQTAKGQQWYFGMKAHVGVDSRTKLVHTVLASAANVADREALPYLLHGNETQVRAQVEHVFGVIKNIFGFRKVRYRGLAKNLHRLEVTAALANLYLVRRRLLKA